MKNKRRKNKKKAAKKPKFRLAFWFLSRTFLIEIGTGFESVDVKVARPRQKMPET
jgi:hypothetical protein